jgi:hypothetical protein
MAANLVIGLDLSCSNLSERLTKPFFFFDGQAWSLVDSLQDVCTRRGRPKLIGQVFPVPMKNACHAFEYSAGHVSVPPPW